MLASGDVNFLVSLAGGMKDGAYKKRVEVRRLLIDEDDGVSTRFFNIDLENNVSEFSLKTCFEIKSEVRGGTVRFAP